MTDTYGQSDAVAIELAAALNNAAFCLPVSATRKFARLLTLETVSVIGQPVTIQVIPASELSSRVGMDGVYDDVYMCNILLLQNISTAGGLSETQAALLLRLRSQIVELVCSHVLSCPNAVHPFERAVATACHHGNEGVYDIARLEEDGLFSSDLIVTYKASGLRRSNP